MSDPQQADPQAPGFDRRSLLQAMLLATVPLPVLAEGAGARFGGTFVVCCGSEPRHLNLNIATDIPTKEIGNPLYSKLVGMKRDLSPRADLATDWSVSTDTLAYTFRLQAQARWHDGTPVTSADVKFTFEEVLFVYHNIGKVMAPLVETIETPDATTVIFRLKRPSDIFMTFIAAQSYIQPRHIYDGTNIMENPANLRPVGCGPFRLVEWSRGREVVLERNPDYFLPDRPYVDRIVTRFIPDASARVRALEAGEVDYLAYLDLPPSAIGNLQKNPEITVTSHGHEAWGSLVELMLNLDRPPFNDVRVRRAVTHAINRPFIVERATFGLARVATGPISSDIAWAYTDDVPQYPYDPAAANRLLDEAGLPRRDGVRFQVALLVPRTTEAFVRAGQIIVEQLRAVGIQVQLRPVDTATAAEAVYTKRSFDMFISSFTSGPDPAIGVERQYVTSNIRPVPFTNGIGYRNAELDALFEQAAASPDRAARTALYKTISTRLADDAAMVWLYENAAYSAFRKDFSHLHSWAAESIYNYSDVMWQKGSPSRG